MPLLVIEPDAECYQAQHVKGYTRAWKLQGIDSANKEPEGERLLEKQIIQIIWNVSR